ncbi:nicotinamide riboside transporter PnuC [Porphyromonas pogonae]|uniref:nicotinamide riboside transporter PnuC n=1 Tax=Porphyromonas pogonae TaxID=867595 RepID=UPI002E75C3BD|nr:nicotinamide riboside transporter PnuC [Porphyromonas pogonae]
MIEFITAHWIELLAAFINFIWVYLEFKASTWLWPVGIILPMLYIVVSLNAHFYGNVIINVYYLVTSIIGWIMWLRKGNSQEAAPITDISRRAVFISLGLGIVGYISAYILLKSYTDSLVPWADALATIISFIGMIWLANKWQQHWFCWMIANFISIFIFYASRDYISTFVFFVNTIVSVLGFFNWRKMKMQQNIK